MCYNEHMKSSSLFSKTRKGVTSIYIVVFATILFGIITLSFTRIMLSEGEQTSNDDLSQSAYDSAMAGVEDAKIAVNDYYRCLSTGSAASCMSKNVFANVENGITCDEDFKLGQILHNMTSTDEVKIQETSGGTDGNGSDQAYTCVIISDVTSDYRSTLTSDTRTKVVPLGVNRGDGAGSTLGEVKQITFSWYSQLNRGTKTESDFRYSSDGLFGNINEATVPPTISLAFLKAPQDMSINDLHAENNQGNVVYSTMVFLPSESGSGNSIGRQAIIDAGNVDSINNPFPVKCNAVSEFACSVTLDVNGLLSNGDSAFLIASLPYGDTLTDFAVTLADGDGNTIKFRGVQVSVDSTGRTNQLFRRVETRLDPADLFFPYPQYALELSGNGDDSFLKSFWVTANCWTDGGSCNNNGPLN